MKKSGTKLSVNLLILSLVSVMALTACERRERPTKPNSAKIEKDSGPNGNLKNGPADGATSENNLPPVEPSAYAKALEVIQAEEAKLVAKGYKIDAEKNEIGAKDVWDAQGDPDKGDLVIACDLAPLKALHEALLAEINGERKDTTVTEEAYAKQAEASNAMIEMLKNEIHAVNYDVKTPDCSQLNPDAVSPTEGPTTNVSADDSSAE